MKIVVDSGCDLTDEIKQKRGGLFETVPLNLQVDDAHFIDDENLDIPSYIIEMEKSKTTVKTAAPSPELYLEKFKMDGPMFVVTLSSFLSASYANAMLAKQLYLDEFPSKFIHVFDSFSASCGELLVAQKVSEYISHNLQELEIEKKVTDFIANMRTYFILEKYDNLVKNGRIGPYAAKLAGLIGIRPICAVVEGKLEVVDKAMGEKKAFSKLIDTIANQKLDFENKTLAISHVSCLDKAIAFKNEILERIKFKEVVIVQTLGTCTTYADRGGIVVAY